MSGGEGGISDVPSSAEVVAALAAAAAGGARGEEPWADPRYYVLDDYLSRADEVSLPSLVIRVFPGDFLHILFINFFRSSQLRGNISRQWRRKHELFQ